jgi:hypothetical protein
LANEYKALKTRMMGNRLRNFNEFTPSSTKRVRIDEMKRSTLTNTQKVMKRFSIEILMH